jgi:iron complex transport system substrate-binding protein
VDALLPRTLRRRRSPALPWLAHLSLIALCAALVLAACNAPAARVSIPPDATGSAAPAATGTPSPEPSPAAFPLTLTDDEGTEVTIAARPERIVSLTPAATETLFAIGAGDRVVAKVEDLANHPPEAADLPVVATFTGVDIEQIVALEADLVIAGGNGGTAPDAIARLRDLGIPVLVVYAADVDAVFRDIELIGSAAGAASEARDLGASMRAGFDQIAAATEGLDRPRVFYETGDQPAIYGVADDSFVAAMVELAGADPVTTGSSSVWEMSQERLIEEDPEIILLGDAAYGVTAEAVAARPGWSGLTAVQAGAIEPIDDVVVTRPGPRLLDGLRALVRAIHPEVELPGSSATPSAAPVPSAGG